MGLMLHFLDVGCGDCTIIHFPSRMRENDGILIGERIMMVDINHDEEAGYTDIIDYYRRHFTNANGTLKPIFRFICTHPHQDHICGLAKLFEESNITVLNFWDLDHDFVPEKVDEHPTHEDDWNKYEEVRKSADAPRVIRVKREDNPAQFWNDDEDRITVLSPSEKLKRFAHYTEDGKKRTNQEIQIDEMSYALMIRFNDHKIILAGDGRATPFWQDIYDNCKSEIKNCVILKAGHHGHECGLHEEALKIINPSLIIFSNSSEEDEANGAEKMYKKIMPEALILKTCDVGTIKIDVPFDSNEKIRYWTDKA